ncbi:hypothetical protein DL766_001528 [Monosporascus sp. MC13-8B]|uniref:Aminoglycoside phosphotransferase domain-containing protein n=1 Tax=Monosporascus cannonballus TaxID=155416 RepID=A0ABY0HIE1_9PEZI|nr:hypothetical protein DL763_007329 [Monosporascus cannonballus]RYO93765.1 hypothetical protein DL762_000970 [Monosporascus cannonballus]RYP37377.1 hypothetical protein DL766_001528 [Monosporascus sp. MC13-8B]
MSWPSLIDAFFDDERDAPYAQCGEMARTIIGKNFEVKSAKNQGQLSYNFMGATAVPKFILSFRLEAGRIDPDVLKLAKEIHGSLVPDTKFCGHAQTPAGKPLFVYKMSSLPGKDFWSIAGPDFHLDGGVVAKRIAMVKSLARCFARAYLKPQTVHAAVRKKGEEDALRRVAIMRKLLPEISAVLDELEGNIPILFGPFYRLVRTHADLSGASIRPFAVDLPSPFLAGGAGGWWLTGKDGNSKEKDDAWREYPRRSELEEAFWAEFFVAARVADHAPERRTRRWHAEVAGKLAIIIRFGFDRRADGSVFDRPLQENKDLLRAWFGNHKVEKGEGEESSGVEYITETDEDE